MAQTVILSALLDRLLTEAAVAPDREICGLLFGDLGRIESAAATRNVADDPATRFEIEPAALLQAHTAARRGGPALIGHYHSHPSGSAEPSTYDEAAAEPGKLWLILGGGGARLWRAGVNGFAEWPLRIVG